MKHERRAALIPQLVADKRAQHPELRQRPTFRSFLAILEREGISLYRDDRPTRVLGLALKFLDRPCILLSSRLRGRARLWVAFHELGHVHLHLTEEASRSVEIKEAEATLYADLIMGASFSQLSAIPER